MKRKSAVSLFLSVLMVMTAVLSAIVPAATAKADDGVTIRLHYHREDNDYTDWDVWFWEYGKDGGGYAFEDEGGDMVATFTPAADCTQVGFIVRKTDWSVKDVGEDQFIDIEGMVSGVLDYYVESGVKGGETVFGDDVAIGIKLKSAVYDSGAVKITMTKDIEEDPKKAFILTGADGTIALNAVNAKGNGEYELVPATSLELIKAYQVIYGENIYDVNMPIYWSTPEFENEFTYTGNDLGATWTKEKTNFRLWAPTAEKAFVNLYKTGTEGTSDLIEKASMTKDVNGTWTMEKEGDLNGVYYTYSVVIGGTETEACDPYARTTGVNGKRAMVIDLDSTDPEGWDKDTDPHAGNNITDAVLYELHVRDLSSDPSSGIKNQGKYLAFTESGTKNANGISTGIDHIKELGVTHVHLLPSYDFGSVNEEQGGFNWGYDPQNYNVPEGSYSTDPYNGEVRVSEFKQMVKSLHDNNISVVMDVVYNHVYNAGAFCINKLVPGYFSRISASGSYSNGSGCGNDTATERSMVRKYIVDSVCYWADEYHIDGFRFDLVGLIDTQTINEIIEEVHRKHPDVIFYGEGWTMTTNVTKKDIDLTTQTNSGLVPGFAFFNDTIRDTIKGSVFDDMDLGYVTGKTTVQKKLKECMLADVTWSKEPSQIINYASCHDNMTLYDRICNSRNDVDDETHVRMNNLAAAIVMTSEGTPFMQAGEEMLRTKVKADGTYDTNSYASGDDVNSLKWDDLNNAAYMATFEYYKGLIAFRKAHSVLRLTNHADVEKSVSTLTGMPSNVAGISYKGVDYGDAEEILVILNSNGSDSNVTLPEGHWNVYAEGNRAGTEPMYSVEGNSIAVEAISATILVKEDLVVEKKQDAQEEKPADMASAETRNTETSKTADDTNTNADGNDTAEDDGSITIPIWLEIVLGIAAIIIGIVIDRIFDKIFPPKKKND